MGQHDFLICLTLMLAALMVTDVLTLTTSPPDQTQEVTNQPPMTTAPLKLKTGGGFEVVSHQFPVTTHSLSVPPGDVDHVVTDELPLTTPLSSLPPGDEADQVTNQLPLTTPSRSSPPGGNLQEVTDELAMTTLTPLSTPSNGVGGDFETRILTVFDEIDPDSIPFVDKILSIEDLVCGGLCGAYPADQQLTRRFSCDRCKCDRLCTVYHDCCPDVLLHHGVEYDGENLATCRLAHPATVALIELDHYTVLDKCPRAAGRMQTNTEDGDPLVSPTTDSAQNLDVLKCENPDTTEPDQSLFVSSAISGLTYGNKYCASCHNDTENLQKWKASLSCKNTAQRILSRISSKDEIHRILLSPEEVEKTGCSLHYRSSDSSDQERTCRPPDPNIISTCNVTGNAQSYDLRIEQACGMYTSVFDKKYKNMFCFICNQGTPYSLLDMVFHAMGFGDVSVMRVSFSALVDFDDDDSSHSFSEGNAEQVQTAADCLQNEYYDILSCECRTPLCSEGKHLTSNGSCESLFSSSLFGYRVCFDLHIEMASEISLENLDRLRTQLKSEISVENMDLLPTQRWPKFSWLSHDNYVKSWCPGSKSITLAVDELFSQEGYLEDIEQGITKRLDAFNTSSFPHAVRYHLSLTNKCFNSSLAANVCDASPAINFEPENRADGFDLKKIYFMPFLHTSQCPFVVLSRDNFTPTEQDDSFIFQPTKKLISASKVDQISESDFQVCVYDYIVLSDTDVPVCSKKVNAFDTWTISGLISIICTCISLFCLLLTFLTYCIFRSLRNGGGNNIMTLIVTLFIAQAFYEFAIEQFDIKTACKVFGIIVHYMWLAAVFSMNACTIERFYKLCFPLQSRAFFMTKKPFILATVYTFVCPMVIVVINIIVNIATRDNIGYGSPRLCYINTSTSRIFAFALPMGLAVVFNTVLMIITIYNLRRKTNLAKQTSSQARIGLIACARLSMITGLMWLLAFLYEAIPSEILSYFFTALIGLQGVMFFVSMGLNKRVIALYSELYTRWRNKQSWVNDSHRHESAHKQDSGTNQHTHSTTSTLTSVSGL